MISFDEAGAMLDDIAEELPSDFYKELNGGVYLLPDIKIHQNSIDPDNLYILGEYHNERELGKYINIYYGSFVKVYSHLPVAGQKEKLREILLHEFTHHLESLAGERNLVVKDVKNLEKYMRRHK